MKLYLLFTVLPLQKKVLTKTFINKDERDTAVLNSVQQNHLHGLIVELAAMNGEYEVSVTNHENIELVRLVTKDVEI